MEDKEKYTGTINEFVDFVTGNDTMTGKNVTDMLPPSGKSIRMLLSEHLRTPFVYYEDIENNLYLLFSSEEAKSRYLSDPETNKNLVLLSFVRPSDYELTTDLNINPRYMLAGDSTQASAVISYNWKVVKGSQQMADTVSAVYTITDTNGNTQNFSRIYSSSATSVQENIYSYLRDGANTVSIVLRGNSTGAMYSASVIFVMIKLSLTSNFEYNARHVKGEDLSVPYVIDRNVTSAPTSIYVYVDGTLVKKDDSLVNSSSSVVSNILSIPNTFDEGQHNLQIYAELEYSATKFRSNLIYFNFVNASSSSKLNYFINIKSDYKNVLPPIGERYLVTEQYSDFTLNWGYYTDNLQTDTSVPVTWKLRQDGKDTDLSTITANKGEESEALSFVPTVYSSDEHPIVLVAQKGDQVLVEMPLIVFKSTMNVYETANYALKLRAYGKVNGSPDQATWVDKEHDVHTTFHGFDFDRSNGWYQNSLRMQGRDVYADINYTPLSGDPNTGRTIEFEFMSEKVSSNDDVLILIGNKDGARIEVTPDSAALYDTAGSLVIKTNYKSNEKNKLCFIINPEDTPDTHDSHVVFIVNNGTLERADSCAGLSLTNANGTIHIGGTDSGVRFYGIRVYNRAISYMDAFSNWVYDSDTKASILSNNNILSNGKIDFNLCVNKVDTILITGDLSQILTPTTDKKDSESVATIERFCPYDNTKNFKVVNAKVRKHGQSTLNYPITSIKFWTNKSLSDAVFPTFSCPYQQQLLLTKNRYKMKNNSIPANKFILQANYADSSGVLNGGLQRLINKTWFNAMIDGEYKLRTEPQLFTTGTTISHHDPDLGEVVDAQHPEWFSGYNTDVDTNHPHGRQWKDYFNSPFPYTLETGPDSTPCVVFYVDTSKEVPTQTFLGQYVLMEDKKSDYCYGERSIYRASSQDPFCMTTTHKDGDVSENRIWDNEHVLRMEVLEINNKYASFISDDGIEDIIYGEDGQPYQYAFEKTFELIYPDPDDLEGNKSKGTDKFGPNSKFLKKVRPFLDFFHWAVSAGVDRNKFVKEAAQHLDLYKLSAYYVYLMKFGLVDSVERNAQWRTDDGTHFYIAPWDMDIGVGKVNTGIIAFEPPMDRNTTLPNDQSVYAFSGRSGIKGTSSYISNTLWDNLEAWDYWAKTITPKVAQALFVAGLSYNGFTSMFDNEYAAKWDEIIYNYSNHFKYVEARGNDNAWLKRLQGSGISYRHWWTSVSNDYYNAKWACGEFKSHYVYIACDKGVHTAGTDIIKIVPTSPMYFNVMTNNSNVVYNSYVTKDSPAKVDISELSLQPKVPFNIYGATAIEELDLSCMATGAGNGFDTLELNGAYSDVLGASIKTLNIGSAIVAGSDGHSYTGAINGKTVINITAGSEHDALGALQTINIRGQQPITSWVEYYNRDRFEVKNVYAMGSGLSNFYSSKSGNKYNVLELPGQTKDKNGDIIHSLTTIVMHDSSWKNMKFYDTQINADSTATFTEVNVDGDYTLNIPKSLKTVQFLGTTGASENSKNFVLSWIKCIQAQGKDLSEYTLLMDGINWSGITFEQLEQIAKFNGGNNKASDGTLKGYIVLETNGQRLTAEQTSKIVSWFGSGVFQKNSSGLVIDHNLNYVQVSIAEPAYIENDKIYLKEGTRAALTATKFALGEDSTQYNWFVRMAGSTESSQSLNGYKLNLERSEDGIMYLVADESTSANFDIEVVCTSGDFISVLPVTIVTVTYPSSYQILHSNSDMRLCNGYPTFWKSMDTEMYVKTTDVFTATVSDVMFSLKDGSGKVLLQPTSYQQLRNNSQVKVNIDQVLGYDTWANRNYSIHLFGLIMPKEIAYYTLEATVSFLSGKTMQVSEQFGVIDDQNVIVANDSSLLYQVVQASYKKQFGTTLASGLFYKTDLYSMKYFDSTLDSGAYKAISSLKTQDNKSIFKYLRACTEVVMDGCTQLTSENESIDDNGSHSQTDFSEMLELQTLSLNGCTALTVDIDLSKNAKITSVDTTGDVLSVILPEGASFTKIALGKPTNVNVVNPTAVDIDQVIVSDSSAITSVDIENADGKGFTLFGKLFSSTTDGTTTDTTTTTSTTTTES